MLAELQRFSADYPRLTAVGVGLLGACVGSFLNVCLHRLPKGESIVTPASRCACGQPIPFWLNLPVVGWLALRGRARCCGGEISLRYPLVELITALLFVSAWTLLPATKAAVAFAFLPLLVLLAGYDLDDMTVPDGPNFTLVGAGIFLSVLVPSLHGHTGNVDIPVLDRVLALGDSLLGVAIGTAIVWWIRTIGTVFAGREAMGEADIILCAGVGAFCGWQGALFCIFGGSIIGVVTALPGLISAKFIKGEEYEGVVPFVPSMAAAGALWFFRGPELVTAWHHWVNG
jgi:leader peptidase (prepilin peptidase)/N-methyltransferase